jgi:glycine/D-amino acid oxidase-like deaminating enzyme
LSGGRKPAYDAAIVGGGAVAYGLVRRDLSVVMLDEDDVAFRAVRGRAGCVGPNQLKSFVHCGMGPCQGRLRGLTVSEIFAEARGVPVSEVGYFRLRPPVKPLRLDELANLEGR